MKNELALTVDMEFLETSSYKYKAENTAKEEKKAVKRLLKLFEDYSVRSTFFTVSNLINNHLDILLEINNRGHEIGCHSRTHQFLTDLGRNELHDEIATAKRELEDALACDINGFRAPALKQNEEVQQKIQEAGYTYDSSMIPSLPIPGWYGGDKVSLGPFDKGQITEIPLGVNPYTRIPISGFFIRFLGQKHLFWSIEQLQAKNIVPVIYIHPFELVSFQNKNNWRQKIRTGHYMLETVEKLCKKYSIVNMNNLVEK